MPRARTAVLPATDAYADYLHTRWRPRARVLGVLSLALTLLLVPLDLLAARVFGAEARSLVWLAAWRLPTAPIALSGLWIHRLPRRARGPAAVVASALYFLLNDWTFFATGQALGPMHLVVLFVVLLACLSYLPLGPRDRALMLAAFVFGHLAVDLAAPDARGLAPRLWGAFALAVGAASMAALVEGLFQAHRRSFLLRQETDGTARALEAHHHEVARAAATLARSMARLAEGARELSAGSAQSRQASEQMAQASDALARSARELEERSQGGAGAAARAADRTRSAEQLLAGIEAGVHDIDAAVERAEVDFHRLEARAERIGVFAEGMQEIAAQTQMLAVNAGLEAHRAGAEARGFGVIAGEVRKLAQEAGLGGREVSEVVAELRRQMDETVRSVRAVRARTADFLGVHAHTRETLDGVQDSVLETEAAMRHNASEATQQAGVTAALSRSTTELLQRIEAQVSLADEVMGTAKDLGALAEHLRALLPRDDEAAAAAARRAA